MFVKANRERETQLNWLLARIIARKANFIMPVSTINWILVANSHGLWQRDIPRANVEFDLWFRVEVVYTTWLNNFKIYTPHTDSANWSTNQYWNVITSRVYTEKKKLNLQISLVTSK